MIAQTRKRTRISTGPHGGNMTSLDRLGRVAVAALAALSLSASFSCADEVADFYKGKTFQFVVGYPPSGGYDAYTRLVTRFYGKHIPGNPTVIVQNMPGASSLKSVQYMAAVAPKDG